MRGNLVWGIPSLHLCPVRLVLHTKEAGGVHEGGQSKEVQCIYTYPITTVLDKYQVRLYTNISDGDSQQSVIY